MPDFLNRLAARALGALPLAEPLIRTRFDPGVEHVGLTPFESINQPARATEAIAESADRSFLRHAQVTPPESGFARFDPPSVDLDDASHLISAQHLHLSPLQNLPQQFTNEPRASWPDAQSTHLAASASPLHSGTSEAEDGVPRVADARRPSGVPLFAEPRPTLTNAALEPDRVSDQHQQQGMSASHRLPPMVRISIGRIEVRAELPARVSAPAPQRGRTSHVSLEQFLKQAGGGAR